MQLLIISGFLGSGKTTILKPFAQRLTDQGKKVAIIENEIGEKGVDDLYLKENGLYVKEIYQGCICCSLKNDLISSLLELERDYRPDVMVMEPTGVADPYLILASLYKYPGKLESKTIVSIVDAERFEDIVDLKTSLAIDGIKIADLIALNKIDLASPAKVEILKNQIRGINPDSTVQSVSAYDERLQDELFQVIESKMFSIQFEEEKTRVVLEKKGILPSVCSKSFEYSKDEICLSELEIKKYFEDRVYIVAQLLKEAGADLIGNVKLIIKSDTDGCILISTTSFSRFPEVNGNFPAGYLKAKFTMNAMVYGIAQDHLDSIIDQVFPH